MSKFEHCPCHYYLDGASTVFNNPSLSFAKAFKENTFVGNTFNRNTVKQLTKSLNLTVSLRLVLGTTQDGLSPTFTFSLYVIQYL